MQAIVDQIKAKAQDLLAAGTVDRVLGWEAGKLAYDRTPAVFGPAEALDGLKYDLFCAANLSKYLIAETKKEGKGRNERNGHFKKQQNRWFRCYRQVIHCTSDRSSVRSLIHVHTWNQSSEDQRNDRKKLITVYFRYFILITGIRVWTCIPKRMGYEINITA